MADRNAGPPSHCDDVRSQSALTATDVMVWTTSTHHVTGRYYRESRAQRERRLSRNERIYRGQDGRYYCRRSDGTTGLIVDAIAGGVLGNMIAPGGSETLGTILGAGAGAISGCAIDLKDARCR